MVPGDLLHILGKDDDNSTSTWYGEMVGTDEGGNLEVFLLERTRLLQGFIWKYNEEWQTIP